MTLSIRKACFDRLYALANSNGLDVWTTNHFLERINVRSPNQDKTMLAMIKSATHCINNRDSLTGQRVLYSVDKDIFIYRLGTHNDRKDNKLKRPELVFVTYMFDWDDDPCGRAVDRKFTIKS